MRITKHFFNFQVGIDPVLRNKIWSYLQELTVKEAKTVILTTHYIEEARNANTIALMRYGSLLAEANPDQLLATFRMSTIEEVFLNLCETGDASPNVTVKDGPLPQDQKINQNQILPATGPKSGKRQRPGSRNVFFAPYNGKNPQSGFFNWLRVWAIIADSFTFINGKIWTILVACLLPTCQIYLFHYSIGKPIPNLPIAVSSMENRTVRFGDILVERLQARNITVVSFLQNKIIFVLKQIKIIFRNGTTTATKH